MKTIVISHVYQQAKPFLKELFESINRQTDKDFDIVIFNYGLDESLASFGYMGLEVPNTSSLGIPEAREWALKYALKCGYDLLILIDADDVMAEDRVEKTKASFSTEFGFYYTDLNVLYQPGVDFFSGNLPNRLSSECDVFECNCVGLSHLAINLKVAAKVIRDLECPLGVIAYDWYLVTILLICGIVGKRVNSTTYYRIYCHNTAGYTNNLDVKHLIKTLNVKRFHYGALESYCTKNGLSKLSILYGEKYRKYTYLHELAKSNNYGALNKYVVKRKKNNSYWWNSI